MAHPTITNDPSVGDLPLTLSTAYIHRYFTESSEIFTAHATVTNGLAVDDLLPLEIQTEYVRW